MRLALIVLALAWPSSRAMAACAAINSFDSAGPCVATSDVVGPNFTFTGTFASLAPAGSVSANVDGSNYGHQIFTATAAQVTETAAGFPGALSTDWSTQDFLFFAYATTNTATAFRFTTEYHILNGATDLYYTAVGTDVSKSAIAAVTDWTPLILSMNYANNLGFAPTAVNSISIRQRGTASAPFDIGYDDLTLQTGGDTPNTPLVAANVAIAASCSSYNLTITCQAQTGTDLIAGYHIYRSTSGLAGPYVSYGYANPVPRTATTVAFTEQAPFFSSVYYKIMPYSISTTAFLGGANGFFVKGGNTLIDPAVIGSAAGGVHEAALSAATAIGPYNQTGACSPTFSPTFSLSPSQTSTFSATPSFSPSSTVTPSSSVTPSITPTPSFSPTVTPFAGSPTDTPTITLTSTITQTFSSTVTSVPPLPTATFTMTPTITMTFSVSSTFTFSPVVTATINPNADAQLYPNPFHPDQGETFHLGNVKPGLPVKIYNIIGEFVIGFTTKGNPAEDRWDSLNANGVRVVTGIYFLQIDGKVYRVAVVRN